MKLVFFICLGYLCFNQVILMSIDEIESDNIPGEIFNSNELCSQMDGQTQLKDLNVDCHFLALKQLDFLSLLSLAETNNHFKSLVSLFLKQMFQKKLVDIVLRWPYTVEMVDDNIKIKNLTIAEQVLSNFGHLIQNLKISRALPDSIESYRSIYRLVNLHCSKTLKEITLEDSVNNLLEEFTNQFENVQNVYIHNILETERRLNEVFPSVRRLHFQMYEFPNIDSINVKYTSLEHLTIFIYANERDLNGILAAELIRKNSHIRSLALENISIKLVKIAADSLPQLDRLKLDFIQCEDSNKFITFANVKILEIEGCRVDSLFLNIKFGNVEELHTDALAENMFGETGFFASNTKLKKLQLESKYHFIQLNNNNLFKQLARANSTLKDIYISRALGVEVETILQLIENNKQLEKLQIILSIDDDFESTSEALSRKIDDNWYMTAFSATIILKKKYILF